jgi:2-C-methyl-D-erythritol 4-phosphate cytidylyltransferase
MKNIALIVAGGSGVRMGNKTPKQFLELHHKPVLMHTIEKFRRLCDGIYLVLPESQFKYWEKLCQVHHFEIPVHLVAGGETRLHSAYNGLKSINTDCLVAIHDGVRPLVDEKVIAESYRVAAEKGSAVAAVSLRDSIREINGTSSQSLSRDNYVLVQTPQTFRYELITDAYKKLFENEPDASRFTDDASVVENYGAKIHIIESNHSNIKITTADDLLIATALLNKKT